MHILIIGGGAAGMSAASKARRNDKNAEITVLESGNFVSYAQCGIPYYLSGKVSDPMNLIHYPVEEFRVKRNINVKTETYVKSVDTTEHTVTLHDNTAIHYDRLIIATGTRAKRLDFSIPDRVHSVRTLDEAIQIKRDLSGHQMGILGDGVLGLELASEFAEKDWEVTLFSKHERILPRVDPAVIIHMNEDLSKKIRIIHFNSVNFKKDDSGKPIIVADREEYCMDQLMVAIGTLPNTEFLKNSSIDMDAAGRIIVNDKMETSVENIYAAGDCAISINRIDGQLQWNPLAQVANKMGRVAGSNASGKRMDFKGSVGTTLVKILDYEVGYCGFSEIEAKKRGFDPESKTVSGWSRAKYYSGGSEIIVKIVYDKTTLRLLGGEICSKDNGAWRLNALETAVYSGMTTEELFYNDLGYTPPFGPVWDPIIICASLSLRD